MNVDNAIMAELMALTLQNKSHETDESDPTPSPPTGHSRAAQELVNATTAGTTDPLSRYFQQEVPQPLVRQAYNAELPLHQNNFSVPATPETAFVYSPYGNTENMREVPPPYGNTENMPVAAALAETAGGSRSSHSSLLAGAVEAAQAARFREVDEGATAPMERRKSTTYFHSDGSRKESPSSSSSVSAGAGPQTPSATPLMNGGSQSQWTPFTATGGEATQMGIFNHPAHLAFNQAHQLLYGVLVENARMRAQVAAYAQQHDASEAEKNLLRNGQPSAALQFQIAEMKTKLRNLEDGKKALREAARRKDREMILLKEELKKYKSTLAETNSGKLSPSPADQAPNKEPMKKPQTSQEAMSKKPRARKPQEVMSQTLFTPKHSEKKSPVEDA